MSPIIQTTVKTLKRRHVRWETPVLNIILRVVEVKIRKTN